MKTKTTILLFVSFILLSFSNIQAQDRLDRRAEWNSFGLRGYKGFLTFGAGQGKATVYNSNGSYSGQAQTFDNNTFIELETVHGYQFNPWFFLGAGVGSQGFTENDKVGEDGFVTSNVFGDFRVNFLYSRITPFVEGKVGISSPFSGELEEYLTTGIFFSPSIGCHFGISRRFGIDLSVGYNYHRFPYEDFKSVKVKFESWVIRLGIDF